MRVGIIGAGHIGGNIARFLAGAGHDMTISFSRDPGSLEKLAAEIGARVSPGSPAEAAASAEVVVVSVPWPVIDEALAQAGPLAGKVVIDTTNQFGAGAGLIPAGHTAAQFNQARMPGARYTKSFNTLTAAFQRRAAARSGDNRVVQWLCGGNDSEAKTIAASLITDSGFLAVDLGGTADAAVMEAPRRAGAVYGEEYRGPDARAVVEAVRHGRPLPPTPSYPST